jgi:hypothetical protein
VNDKFSWEGISLLWVLLGFIGAALGIGSMPEMTKKQLWTALGSGVVCAALAPSVVPELIGWWRVAPVVPLPGPIGNLLAFFFGIGGMFIVPGCIVMWSSWKKNPWAVVNWIRGRGQPPSGDDEGAKQ